MENNVLEEAIANIASVSKSLEDFCNKPDIYNVYGSQLIEKMSWELYKQANDLREIRYLLGL